MGELLRDAIDLVVPRRCGGCGRPGWTLCRPCRLRVSGVRPHLLAWAGEGVPMLSVASGYAGTMGRLILTHKRRFNPAIARTLGEALTATIAGLAAAVAGLGCWRPPVLLVPVPGSRSRWARQPVAELLTEVRARELGAVPVSLLLARRARRPQKSLTARERAGNLRNAWRVRAPPRSLAGAAVVIVDDVVTTGASLAVAAQLLTAADLRVVGGAALATSAGADPW